MKRQVVALTLLCAVAVATAAGCGSDKSNDFRKNYNKIVREYSSLPTDVGGAVRGASGRSDAALAAQFGELADRTGREVDRLAKLDPPDKAKDEYSAFLAAVRKIEGDLRSISDAAKAHDAKRARDSARSLVTDAQETTSQEQALKKAVK